MSLLTVFVLAVQHLYPVGLTGNRSAKAPMQTWLNAAYKLYGCAIADGNFYFA